MRGRRRGRRRGVWEEETGGCEGCVEEEGEGVEMRGGEGVQGGGGGWGAEGVQAGEGGC